MSQPPLPPRLVGLVDRLFAGVSSWASNGAELFWFMERRNRGIGMLTTEDTEYTEIGARVLCEPPCSLWFRAARRKWHRLPACDTLSTGWKPMPRKSWVRKGVAGKGSILVVFCQIDY